MTSRLRRSRLVATTAAAALKDLQQVALLAGTSAQLTVRGTTNRRTCIIQHFCIGSRLSTPDFDIHAVNNNFTYERHCKHQLCQYCERVAAKPAQKQLTQGSRPRKVSIGRRLNGWQKMGGSVMLDVLSRNYALRTAQNSHHPTRIDVKAWMVSLSAPIRVEFCPNVSHFTPTDA